MLKEFHIELPKFVNELNKIKFNLINKINKNT